MKRRTAERLVGSEDKLEFSESGLNEPDPEATRANRDFLARVRGCAPDDPTRAGRRDIQELDPLRPRRAGNATGGIEACQPLRR